MEAAHQGWHCWPRPWVDGAVAHSSRKGKNEAKGRSGSGEVSSEDDEGEKGGVKTLRIRSFLGGALGGKEKSLFFWFIIVEGEVVRVRLCNCTSTKGTTKEKWSTWHFVTCTISNFSCNTWKVL
jgi:hypothetical protein